jgi:ABC-type bacteriocin/lantibiotic exporter with double-glycine peptidase domain
MRYTKPASTSIFLALSLFVFSSFAGAQLPDAHSVDGLVRLKQLTNYCGPGCLTSVLRYYGVNTTQEAVGKQTYDPATRATNGADMLLYARSQGFAAYSWNTSIDDVKNKIAAGAPVIVLQQNSRIDTSGHYRVLTGYDDSRSKFKVIDPYYDNITELSYSECESLWKSKGHWALVIVPTDKDKFSDELGAQNPVVHMDMAYAQYTRKNYDEALKEAQAALKLQPQNSYTLNMLDKIERAMGAGTKG